MSEAPSTEPTTGGPPGIDYEAVQASPEFRELKRRFTVFVLPVSIGFLAWFVVFVLLSAYARDLMATPLWGGVNLGIALGLGQFVTTFAITMLYVRYANRRLDPVSRKIRVELEAQSTRPQDQEDAR